VYRQGYVFLALPQGVVYVDLAKREQDPRNTAYEALEELRREGAIPTALPNAHTMDGTSIVAFGFRGAVGYVKISRNRQFSEIRFLPVEAPAGRAEVQFRSPVFLGDRAFYVAQSGDVLELNLQRDELKWHLAPQNDIRNASAPLLTEQHLCFEVVRGRGLGLVRFDCSRGQFTGEAVTVDPSGEPPPVPRFHFAPLPKGKVGVIVSNAEETALAAIDFDDWREPARQNWKGCGFPHWRALAGETFVVGSAEREIQWMNWGEEGTSKLVTIQNAHGRPTAPPFGAGRWILFPCEHQTALAVVGTGEVR
jgi:hypothetical protein